MSNAKSPSIVIVSDCAQIGERVRSALATTHCTILHPGDDVTVLATVDVLVTDLSSVHEARCRAASLSPADAETQLLARATVLGIGDVQGADATVEDPGNAEAIRIACLLLAEIARLRTEHDLADRAGRRHRELAYTDPLTGVANRRAWDESLRTLARTASESGAGWCLAIVDLDRFKAVNETRGLGGGDLVLAAVAEGLSTTLRQNDLVARIGGDEFGVLLHGVSSHEAVTVLERLRVAVAATKTTDGVAPVTASIGYALQSTDQTDGQAMFAAAEQALRDAKRQRGDRVIGSNEAR